ncbi:MAG: MFS transporter [Minisyncoccia bacterium]
MNLTEEKKLNEKEIEESKKYSLKEAVFTNITMGAGESYIAPYIIALGGKTKEIGFLSAFPNLFAPLSQLFTWKLMEKLSRKKILSIFILLQALIYLPFILIFLFFLLDKNKSINYSFLAVILYTLYAIFGSISVPVWASWIGDLIKKEEISRFLGKRNSRGSIFYFISFFLAGILLDFLKKKASEKNIILFFGFFIIFLIAMISKIIARYFILKQDEIRFKPQKESYFSFFDFLREAPKRNYGRFSIYIALIIFSTNIAGPYFSLYMLSDLKFSYFQFMMANIATIIITFISMPFWGKFSEKYGNIYTLKIGSFLIPIVALLWTITLALPQKFIFYFVFLINLFSGLAWSAFNLAAGNFVFDVATPQKRSLCVAYSNIINGFGVFLGATFGNILMPYFSKISYFPIMILAFLSGVLRFFIALIFVFKIKEVKIVEKEHVISVQYLFSQMLSLPSYLQNIIIKKRK